jgi:hypothetical protein
LNVTNIKAGTTAIIKSTQEPVMVLHVAPGKTLPEAPDLEQTVVIVRRPVQGSDGVRHVVETFWIQELETQEEKHTRQLAEMEEMKMRFSPRETMPSQGELFSTN